MKYTQNPKINNEFGYAAAVLYARGVKDVNHFLDSNLEVWNDPFLLDNMLVGMSLFLQTLKQDKPIALIVDCDMDGICSAAMVYNYIKLKKPSQEIVYFLHSGKQHGLEDVIEQIEDSNEDFSLLIIPDASSNDHIFHERLEKLGIKILILDHHEADNYSTHAIVINNQLSKDFNNKSLSGAGIVLKFIQALDLYYNENNAAKFYDLAAAAIVADVMNLEHLETQTILRKGFHNIQNFGLKTFIEKQEFSIGDTVTPISIGFYIAPIVNSILRVGTMEEKDLLFRAFICGNETEPSTKRGHKSGDMEIVAEKAFRIGSNCRNRQNKLIDKGQEIIQNKITSNGLDEYPIIYVALDEEEASQIPSELTGLIAMRISSFFNKPTLVGRLGDENCFKGSARGNEKGAIKDLKEFTSNSGLFEFCEGHANAYGFSIKGKNIDKFLQYSKDKLKDLDISDSSYEADFIFNKKTIDDAIDAAFEFNGIREVWGNNLVEPIIVLEDIYLKDVDILVMGEKKDSIKITINGLQIVKFKDKDFIDKLNGYHTPKLTAVGHLIINKFHNSVSPQFVISDYELVDGSRDF